MSNVVHLHNLQVVQVHNFKLCQIHDPNLSLVLNFTTTDMLINLTLTSNPRQIAQCNLNIAQLHKMHATMTLNPREFYVLFNTVFDF